MSKRYMQYGFILASLVLASCGGGGDAQTGTDESLPPGSTLISKALRIELAGDSANLSWPTNVQILSYHLTINGENGYQNYLEYPAGTTQHTEPMLAANVLYDFEITAFDVNNQALEQYRASARVNQFSKQLIDETTP